MIKTLSDISRTNQVQITSSPEDVAEKLYQYLFKKGKGIERFPANEVDIERYANSDLNFFQKRHRAIKHEIKKRLSEYGDEWKNAEVEYGLSQDDGKTFAFFLSPNRSSGWKDLFSKKGNTFFQKTILNLVFKVHLLSESSPDLELTHYWDSLLLLHPDKKPTKKEDGLYVWGQSLFLNYNHHNVLTLMLSRKNLLLSEKDPYRTFDGEDMGEILVYNERKYYFSKKLDARRPNPINFMHFPKSTDNEPFEEFKKTQFYHYQNLMSKLEGFLNICGIAYTPLDFQATHYLQNPFIRNIHSVKTLEIINNSGTDLTESDKQFLENFFHRQGIPTISFYHSAQTINTYELQNEEEKLCWKINEFIPWEKVIIDRGKNYLVFNKILDGETESSMAYKQGDLWYPTSEIDNKSIVDFYSQLKRKISYMDTGEFVSIQGINMSEFKIIADKNKTVRSILNYPQKKIEPKKDELRQDAQAFTNGKFLEIEEICCRYLSGEHDQNQWENFCKKYDITITPEMEKILIELGIKNWIREALSDSNVALPVNLQSFSEQQFFAIYVRSPQNQAAKAVVVEFLYKNENLYLKSVLREMKKIRERFPFLKTRMNKPEVLVNDQQYFVDEENQIFISCYTNDSYTPTLIGRKTIIKDLQNGTLEINRRKGSKLLPLVLYYNDAVQQVKNLICLDLHNKDFIQYYVPPAKSLKAQLKKADGFRVYHLVGWDYSKKPIPTAELIKHPITSLHFNTLTYNILKISDNSQSSLLQKVAKIFIEN